MGVLIEGEVFSKARRDVAVTTLFLEAVALEEAEKPLEASIIYKRILQLNPGSAEAWVNLGTIYYRHRGWENARCCYLSAIRINPQYALAYFDLGNTWDNLKEHESAIGAYKIALEICPMYADTHYNLALVYEKVGHYRKALVHWQRYTLLNSAGPCHTHAKERVEAILAEENLKALKRTAS
jgi:tetratricopeptide (TPR) repeat protein